jgi:hypothetical protein
LAEGDIAIGAGDELLLTASDYIRAKTEQFRIYAETGFSLYASGTYSGYTPTGTCLAQITGTASTGNINLGSQNTSSDDYTQIAMTPTSIVLTQSDYSTGDTGVLSMQTLGSACQIRLDAQYITLDGGQIGIGDDNPIIGFGVWNEPYPLVGFNGLFVIDTVGFKIYYDGWHTIHAW